MPSESSAEAVEGETVCLWLTQGCLSSQVDVRGWPPHTVVGTTPPLLCSVGTPQSPDLRAVKAEMLASGVGSRAGSADPAKLDQTEG